MSKLIAYDNECVVDENQLISMEVAIAGYPITLFMDLIDRSRHNCGLCRQILRGPVSTKCGHVFCFVCLKNWLARCRLCPLGCNAVDLSELRSATEIEEEISRLFVKCSNWKIGCNKIMKLWELDEHVFNCNYSATDASKKEVMVGWTGNSELPFRSSSFNLKHSPSIKSPTKSLTVERTCHHYEEIESFYPDDNNTLPPVDNRVVRRKSYVREHPKRGSSSPVNLNFQPLSSSTTALSRHSFTSPLLKKDYSPIQTSSVKKECTVTNAKTPSLSIKRRIIPTVMNVLGFSNGLKKPLDKEVSGSFSHLRQSSSPANVRGPYPVSNGPDSGLSSGDKSPYPENQTLVTQAIQGNTQYRTSLRTQKEMKQLQQRQRRSASPVKAKVKNRCRNIKNMGEYELEEITLHKNVSSRLGVTLAYDEKSDDSNIYVVEILPDGIAAQDARLQVGDIITKVNGFEVYDTEEAILYFLEQDPAIVLSVARPLQKKPLQECSPLRGLRRYDSCGSLDSRNVNQITKEYNCYNSQEYSSTHKGEKVANTTEEGDSGKFLMNHNNELTAETDELCNPSVHLHAPRYTSNETQV